ncbi:nuclear transport factor 2 family protein [Dinghuibacter silviterrae]|uniref:nuclear transport factor 2 family protein n=1 Tax=Dinghuibacter silviterrae TaxID=1539049 RepID=UPI0013C31B44|nr:nuclear transport factor 2 family protein [Dinghuibacter silviterrae]
MTIIVVLALRCVVGYGQNAQEVSTAIFRLEVSGRLDSLDALLDPRMVFSALDGRIESRDQYLQRLKGGNFMHNSIEVEESNEVVAENTAIVTGKGTFVVTVSGTKTSLHLSYIEVFVRPEPAGAWKLIALKATPLNK